MRVFRISKCNYIEDLSGTGAALYGGRWNSKGSYIIYTAATASLALLETIVHMNTMPQEGFCLLEIEIPENFKLLTEKELPRNWADHPPPSLLRKIGDDFVKKQESLALKIPSAVLPEEFIFLINPTHPDFKKLRIIKKKNISLDQRLRPRTSS
jgi:RES domain-containing protein